jgi:hypothetical protein
VKREMAKILRMQAEKTNEIRSHERGMNKIEEGLNRYYLNGSPEERRSIDTFQMDHYRKRQYATLEKSLNISSPDKHSPKIEPNYFARRGVSLLE